MEGMTPIQMRERSSSKVKQVMDMMKVLNLRIEPRQRVDEQGFLGNTIFWIDDEKYQPIAEAPGAPVGADTAAEPMPAAEEKKPIEPTDLTQLVP